MSTVIQILVLLACMVAGGWVARTRWAPRPAWTDRIIKLVLRALLLVMGFRLGNERGLFAQLPVIGLTAGLTAAGALLGTILCIMAAYRLGLVRGQAPGRAAPADARDAPPGQAAAEPAGALPAANGAAGRFWRRWRDPLSLLAMVVAGTILGAALPEMPGLDYSLITGWVLNALLFMIGVQFAQAGLSLRATFLRFDTLAIPLATLVGSLAGSLPVAWWRGLPVGHALSLGAGFGWYSLSGVIIGNMGDPALGAAAFLANLLREAGALLLIPLLAASRWPYAAIGAGGATAMDVTLPLVEQSIGPEAVPTSFASGAILSLLVPVLVPLLYNLG